MPQHLICITFDFDAISGFIARGMTSPTPISRGEFGPVAVPRILALLKDLNIPTTWFTPGHTLESFPKESQWVIDAGHEIGHHGWTHRPPNEMNPEEEEAGLLRANDVIGQLTGKAARGYRSPSWDLSPVSVDLLLKHGFLYDSSMMGNDYMPYRVRQGDVITLDAPAVWGKATRLVELPVSWTLDDFPHFEYLRTRNYVMPGLMNPNTVLDSWLAEWEYFRKSTNWGVLTYTLHPFVIGRGQRMMLLEQLLNRLSGDGAHFITMEAATALYQQKFPYSEE